MNLEEIDKKYVLNTYPRNYTNFKSGDNAKLFDENGTGFIDFTSGIGVVSVGHANKRVLDAICKQAKNILHISNLYLIEPQTILAKEIVTLSKLDGGVFFANSGAEANEGAIKIARKYGEVDGKPKRYKVITLKHSFHGRTISTLKATGQESMHNYFGPFPDGFVYADDIDKIESLLDNHTVAVMIELVQGEGGVEPLDKKKVQNLAKLLKQKDILLIIDEVQTGIYRTGKFLASNLYEITPDIVTLAKGLGGGVPIGAILTTKKDVLKVGDHGSTFGGNYLVTRASLEVLDILKNENLQETIDYFDKKLQNLLSFNFVKKAVGIGLMRGLRIKDAKTLTSLINECFNQKVLVLKAGRDTLRFLPPLTITKDEINEGFKRVEKAFNTISN